MRKLKALLVRFTAAIGHRVASYYGAGILYDRHFFTWIYIWSGHTSWALNVEAWGWFFGWTAAFTGSGMLIGLSSALSMFAGSVLAWDVIGPLLVHHGEAIGHRVYTGQPEWDGLYSFASLSNLGKETPSPRYWLLWLGVVVVVCSSMAEPAVQYKVIWYGVRASWHQGCVGVHGFLQRRGRHSAFFASQAAAAAAAATARPDGMVEDSARPEDQVRGWMWGSGRAATMIIGDRQWGMHPGLALLSIVLAFMFALLAIQIGGATTSAQRINLFASSMASGGAPVAMDLTSDCRTGFLLGTPARQAVDRPGRRHLCIRLDRPGHVCALRRRLPMPDPPEQGREVRDPGALGRRGGYCWGGHGRRPRGRPAAGRRLGRRVRDWQPAAVLLVDSCPKMGFHVSRFCHQEAKPLSRDQPLAPDCRPARACPSRGGGQQEAAVRSVGTH